MTSSQIDRHLKCGDLVSDNVSIFDGQQLEEFFLWSMMNTVDKSNDKSQQYCFDNVFCQDVNCQYLHPRRTCRYWINGYCNRGLRCTFAHANVYDNVHDDVHDNMNDETAHANVHDNGVDVNISRKDQNEIVYDDGSSIDDEYDDEENDSVASPRGPCNSYASPVLNPITAEPRVAERMEPLELITVQQPQPQLNPQMNLHPQMPQYVLPHFIADSWQQYWQLVNPHSIQYWIPLDNNFPMKLPIASVPEHHQGTSDPSGAYYIMPQCAQNSQTSLYFS